MFYYGGILVLKSAELLDLSNQKYSSNNVQLGFTLIELMISLVLGLLISAAVIQIYLTNVRTATIQKSGSELQDASVFGIQLFETHIRLANLGNNTNQINDTTAGGGIVLSASNIRGAPADYPTIYMSRSTGDTPTSTPEDKGWTGISNMDVGSDQLTIQFTNVTDQGIADCEGNTIEVNDSVIERYFLRESTSGAGTGTIKNLVLACDAGRLDTNGVKEFTGSDQHNFGQAGQEFINNVDQFKILLGTQSITSGSAGNMQYINIHDYNALTEKPPIVAIKVGLIVHGSTPVIGSNDLTSFTILGTQHNLKTDTTRSKQVRTSYESTSMLRNARVIAVTAANAATTLP